ncbi:TPA: hypothetical protein O4G03_001155 [Proteus mirabilis]|uniref:hypothetical protein n=1 Tax=Proteus TaxID=583 RepID=UPI00053817EA|nr:MULTISPECIES: hypothetical protein [Proteus]AUU13813.1 hypothetical protein MC53_007305 [Proteus mirabilis]EKT8509260.1 hypothetical protein [Proteus mirabilis]EKV9968648.1 hypothetical protein [Proteus mirabilis]ELA7787485.1 hypothetical protein [Proteus mirabilis]ELB1077648.1 hypothetical protein [Proteus mirabilis]
MTMKLFGKDDEYKTFVLSIGNKKNISLGEYDISLGRKDLSLLISNSNRDFMIVNKDKEVLFLKFTLELKCALEKYIFGKNKKKDRLKKLKDILEKERLTDKIKILDNKVIVSEIKDANDINVLFSSLLKNKDDSSTLFNKIFSNKNTIINSFISKKEKKISDDIEKIANKIMRNPEFTLYNNKSLKYQHITTISNKIFKEPENTDITNDDSHNKNNLDKIKKEDSSKKNKKSKKTALMEQLDKDKKKMNELLAISSQGLLKTVEYIDNLSNLISSKTDNGICNSDLIDQFKMSIETLVKKCNVFNKDSQFLPEKDIEIELSDIKITIEELNEIIKKMESFKSNQLYFFYKEADESNFTTVNEINVNFKKVFFNNIKDMFSQLSSYNKSLKENKGFFLKLYKLLFKNKYLRKKEINDNAVKKLEILDRDLFFLLESKDFKNNYVPDWACKLVAKIINESMPRNDIFWRFSKERTEWNKIYKSFIVDRSFIVERKREEI